MEEKTKKAINFDLDTKKLEDYYGANITKAYSDMRSFMEKNEFEHRQGSGYVSVKAMSEEEIREFNKKLFKSLPFLRHCSRQVDATEVGQTYDLKDLDRKQTERNSAKVFKKITQIKSSLTSKIDKFIQSKQIATNQNILQNKGLSR